MGRAERAWRDGRLGGFCALDVRGEVRDGSVLVRFVLRWREG